MHFYGLSYRDTLDLPLSTFWMMSSSINRINAEQDIRLMSVMASVNSEQGFKDAHQGLRNEMGEVFKKSEVIEIREGLKTLKRLSQM